MYLAYLSVYNFRSIKHIENVRFEALQSIVGSNNAGKSNILKAVNVFLSTGSGGLTTSDFNTDQRDVVIEGTFRSVTSRERQRLRPYMIGDELKLQKRFSIGEDTRTGKVKIDTEYHGYKAEPAEWWLSIAKIEAQFNRPNWREIAEEHGILEYVTDERGRVTKTSYRSGIERYIRDNPDIEYDEPELGETQALGLQPSLLSALPRFYLLPAITDYNSEVDRRSNNTVFRRLMGDLSDRIIREDPRFDEVERAIRTLSGLFNHNREHEHDTDRLGALSAAERSLRENIADLMPSVEDVQINVEIGEAKEWFSRGVSLRINDGVTTDVVDKGHGLQRSVVFGLLRRLIQSERQDLYEQPNSIILAIEEPELYIHPQSQRLIYNVIKGFAGQTDGDGASVAQVMHTTHSPAFIDVAEYERISIARKPDVFSGTAVHQCDRGVLGSPEERQNFKLLTSFSLEHNQAFFANHIVLVEGQEDRIAFIAAIREMGLVSELPAEMGIEVLVTDGKQNMPKFLKVLNSFGVPYSVLLEKDGKPEADPKNSAILRLADQAQISVLEDRLEATCGRTEHFPDVFYAKNFFADTNNITPELVECIRKLIPLEA